MKNIITLLVLLSAICFSAEKKVETELPPFEVIPAMTMGDNVILVERELMKVEYWKTIKSKVYTITELNKELDTGIKFENRDCLAIVPNPNSSYVVTTDVGDMKDLEVFVNWNGNPLAVKRQRDIPDEAKEIPFNKLMFMYEGMKGYKNFDEGGFIRMTLSPVANATLKIKLDGKGPVNNFKGGIQFKIVCKRLPR